MTKRDRLKHYQYALDKILSGGNTIGPNHWGRYGVCELLAHSQGKNSYHYSGRGEGSLKKDFPEFCGHEPEEKDGAFWWDKYDDAIRIEVLRDCISQLEAK